MSKYRNYYGKFWTKLIAMLLCMVSAIGIVGSSVGLFVCGIETKEEWKQDAYGGLEHNYSLLALKHFLEAEDSSDAQSIPELNNINFEYGILESNSGDESKVDFSDAKNYVAGKPMEDYDYVLYGGVKGQVDVWGEFHTDSLPGALTSDINISHYDDENNQAEMIRDFVFSRKDGMIYAKTNIGYFPLDSFDIYRQTSANRDEAEEENTDASEIYSAAFNYEKSEDKSAQCGADVYRPDVQKLTEDYLKDSLYIYFHDEVLYWNKDELYQFSGSKSLNDLRTYFGDSVWSVKFVDEIDAAKIREASRFDNLSEENRGWVYYDKNAKERKYYWVVSQYVEKGEHDLFTEAGNWIDFVFRMQKVYGLCLILFGILFLAGLAYLLMAAGIREGEDELHLTMWHRLPWGIYTCGMGGIEAVIGIGLVGWIVYGTRINADVFWIVTMIPIAMLLVLVAVIYCMNLSVRVKSGRFWRYTLLYRILSFIKRRLINPVKNGMQRVREHIALRRKAFIAVVVVYLIELLLVFVGCVVLGIDYSFFAIIIPYTIVYVVKAAIVLKIAGQLQLLQEGSERVAAGQLDQPIDTSHLIWEFKAHGENINRVGDGINAAVQERLKSERFKTELITNVSHDIKTPLTSIINYVDLMKKQEITDPTLLEYMDVLDRQSARLKKLIEDLMEASKASTGNLTVNWETMDITVLLTQVIGEFEERLKEKGLELIVDSPNPPVNVRADGRHLWRIFDNLMNNICKYAQAGTRVYINMLSEEQVVRIVFRNTSAYQLNITSDELMERFVRGDSSRNTEGSGLGLSIAQSLAELMNGTIKLYVDGDLFKVELQFPLNTEKN